MSGQTEGAFVLDSNTIIGLLNKTRMALPKSAGMETTRYFISFITRMEILAKPDHTPDSIREVEEFFHNLTVIPMIQEIERTAIEIRRSGQPRPKLPDAIVAATAVVMDFPLVTNDDKLLKLIWPELQILNI